MKSDWRKPSGSDGKGWVSKANYQLRDRYSVRALFSGKVRMQNADKEVRKEMESEALFAKYLTNTADASGDGDGGAIVVK